MPRVAGLDPGTGSLDLVVLDDGAVVLERCFQAADPEPVVAALRSVGPLDLVAGPSGYGLPLVPLREVGERELRLMLLAEEGTPSPLRGLRGLVARLREAGLPVVFLPAVLHLPTVPSHRKVNRIDMGTADKLCVAAFACVDQARRRGVALRETSFVLVEAGGAFTAVLAVEEGRVVSGQGGSSGPLGYRSAGALDGEVACLLGALPKAALFTGGVSSIAGTPPDAPGEADSASETDRGRLAWAAFTEGIVKAVAAERALLATNAEIVLSGRLSRVPFVREELLRALARFGPVHILASATTAKEAAHGAALIADGLAGGRHQTLVHTLGLKEAAGTVLDHLYLDGAEKARAWIARAS